MLRGATKKDQTKASRKLPSKRSVFFPGLVRDAKTLGCHRNHLYQVLRGLRTSHSLKRRYQQLKEGK